MNNTRIHLFILNRKTVNGIYLNLLTNGGELSSQDSLSLLNIALITPYLGGDAVYSARVLLDIDAMDYGISYRGDGSTIQANTPGNLVKVYPNPVQNALYIDILTPITEPVFISVYDINGRELIQEELLGITTSLKTHNLVAGTYFYKIYTSSIIIKQDKFIKLPTTGR
jgi:hypothetical protein